MRIFVLFFVLGCAKEESRPSFRVDYSHEVRELSESYDHVPWDVENYDISSWDRMDLEQRVEFELLTLPGSFDAEDAIRQVSQRGMRSANMDELLSFGRTYEEEYRGRPLFGLGTLWKSPDFDMHVAYLYSSSAGRNIGLWIWRQELPSDARFLAIRENSD